MEYVCFNHKIISNELVTLEDLRRGFLYGDGFFESIYYQERAPLLEFHLERMHKAMQMFKFEYDDDIFNEDYLLSKFKEISEKNLIKGPSKIRLSVWRKGKSMYTPETNSSNTLIEINPLNVLQTSPRLGYSEDLIKPRDRFENIKKLGNSFYVWAGHWCHENDFDECLIFNQYHEVIETLYSNIFIVKAEKIITPLSNIGGVSGVMKKALSENLPTWGYSYLEAPLHLHDIIDADEIFLSNGIKGIQIIENFNGKKYKTQTGQEICNQVRKKWF